MAKKPQKRVTTPEQIAKYGAIAAVLRKYMTENNITVPMLNIRMGVERGSPNLYNILNARSAPGKAMLARLVKATGLPESALTPPGPSPSPGMAMVKFMPDNAPRVMLPVTRDILKFNVADNGMATIVLNATLPLDIATPLLRMLLDSGVVFNKVESNAN